MSSGRYVFSVFLLFYALPATAQSSPPAKPTVLHVTFVGQGSSYELFTATAGPGGTPPGDIYKADVTWRARWDVLLPDPRVGFPQNRSFSPALSGTVVSGKTSVIRVSGNGNCTDQPRVVNTFHGSQQPQQSPFIGILPPDPNTGPTKINMFVEAFGGYDFRLCDGLWLPAVGDYGPPQPGYPSWDTIPVVVKFTIDTNDWIGQGEKKMTLPVGYGSGDGQGDYTTVAGAVDSGHVQWSGKLILSTETCSGRSEKQATVNMQGLYCGAAGPAQTFSPEWGLFGVRPKLNSSKSGSLELKCDTVPGYNDYQFILYYTPPGGDPHAIGSCVWPNGCNSLWIGWEGGDIDDAGDFVPLCIDETHWISRDFGDNTVKKPENTSPFTGRSEQPPVLDFMYFDYDVFTDELRVTDNAYAYNYGPPVPQCDDATLKNNPPNGALKFSDMLVDPPLGDATDAFFAGLLDTLSQFPPGVSTGSPYSAADFTFSGAPDQTSAAAFQTALGRCIPDAQYNPAADLDNDGCNTLRDYQIWFRMFQPQGDVADNPTPPARILPPANSINVGDAFTVSIVADISNPVVAWGAALDYSHTALRLDSVSVDTAWLPGSGPTSTAITGLAFPNPISGTNRALATWSFTALRAGDTTLTLTIDPTALTGGFAFAAGDFSDYALQTTILSVGMPSLTTAH